jgi:hypothetical protein
LKSNAEEKEKPSIEQIMFPIFGTGIGDVSIIS